MPALPLNEVPARVVAWHNRHPLARRIRPSQVHSIGTVLLPFASALPWPDAPAAVPDAPSRLRSGPSLAEVVSARAAARPGVQGRASTEGTATATDPPSGNAHDVDRAAEEMPVAEHDDARPAIEPSQGPSAAPSASHRPGWLGRSLACLTGLRPGTPRLVAVFDRDMFWPLTPAQVARWARRHGQRARQAPADLPHRTVAADPAQLGAARQKGLHETVHLHLLTAAVGVGDRSLRLLLDAQGQVFGPRAYSRPRLAGMAGLCLAGLLALGSPWLLPGPAMPADSTTMAAGAAAAGSAPVPITMTDRPIDGAEATASTIAATSLPAGPAASVPSELPPAAPPPAPPSSPAASIVAAASSSPVAPPDRPPAAGHADEHTSAQARRDAAPVRVRPALSDDEKRAAREASNRARNEAPAPPAPVSSPDAPVYAVVTAPSARREAAASGLALMRSARARLVPPAPDRSELMHSQGTWRAAWWPFTSLADAERARVMLAGQGLRAEVVEF